MIFPFVDFDEVLGAHQPFEVGKKWFLRAASEESGLRYIVEILRPPVEVLAILVLLPSGSQEGLAPLVPNPHRWAHRELLVVELYDFLMRAGVVSLANDVSFFFFIYISFSFSFFVVTTVAKVATVVS